MNREQYNFIAMTEYLNQQEIHPDFQTTLTWIFSENSYFLLNILAKDDLGNVFIL